MCREEVQKETERERESEGEREREEEKGVRFLGPGKNIYIYFFLVYSVQPMKTNEKNTSL